MGQLKNLSTTVRLTVANPSSENKSAFGPGISKLCRGVREMGSLNAAAKGMRMAYSKAWRIVRDTETALGITLLNREGAHGSTLTDDCERLLAAFTEMEEKLQRIAGEEFAALL